MGKDFFLVLDFDGTITNEDVTDLVLNQFALPAWLDVEAEWQKGLIGSSQCLTEQMALIDTRLPDILAYVDTVAVDPGFPALAKRLQAEGQPFAVISDGFKVFIDRILTNSGLRSIPVYANGLAEKDGQLTTSFPNSAPHCSAGTCKCSLAKKLGGGLPVVLVGDGRSDYCLAKHADFVFATGKLSGYCKDNAIAYTSFTNMTDLSNKLAIFSLFFSFQRIFCHSLTWDDIFLNFKSEGC